MNQRPLFNPFPGLRPFRTDESHLFFGREGQSEEVLENLTENRFVAVIGASGSGKSSLMYCGVIPILYDGFDTVAGSRWKLITTRPGNNPLGNLAESVAAAGASDESESGRNVTLGILRRSSDGLVEAIRLLGFPSEENVLLMVDQFEELFRYRKSREDHSTANDSERFVKLLVEAVSQEEIPIYVVLTMRSDFIGECSNYQELTELINRSNYLIPQMTREDFRLAVEGPVSVAGAGIDPQLLQLLLNEVGDNPDQLPILQHALMRTWDYWMQFDDPDKPISISDYEAVGKMSGALSEHANEAFDELTAEEKVVCESLFKTLTEKGSDNRGIRHPTTVKKIAAIAGTGTTPVLQVAETFRKAGRSFVTPAPEKPLHEDSVIDLSHESLMRIWNRLKIWVEEEAQAVQMYTRLAESAAMFQVGKTGLWRPPDLQLALNWKSKQNPNLEWARRYHPAFERTMVFLETSEKEHIAEEENKIKQQRRALRRTRIFAIVLGSAAIISLGFMVFAFDQKTKAEENRIRAEQQSQLAEERRQEADKQRELAVENEQIAREAETEAELRRAEAEEQRRLAVSNETRARQQESLALQREQEAREERARAVASAEEAEKQRNIADRNAQEAYQRRMLSIAQSMSVKSLQVLQDNNLKALLSYQAFMFNREYGGPEHHQDIYTGLYETMKAFLGDSVYNFNGHLHSVNSVVFRKNGREFFTAGSDGRILQWNLLDDHPDPGKVYEDQYIKRVLCTSRDDQWLACGTEGEGILLFHGPGKGTPVTIPAHNGQVLALEFLSGKNLLVSAGLDKKIMIWDVPSGNLVQTIETGSAVLSLSVSFDDSKLAAGFRDGSVSIWETSTWTASDLLEAAPEQPVYSVSFGNQGKWLAVGNLDGKVEIWDYNNSRMVTALRGHTARVNDIVFSPGDEFVASAGMDGKVQVWQCSDWTLQPLVISDTEGFVFSVAFSEQGSYLVAGGSGDYRLMVRPVRSGQIAEEICVLLNRNMTRDEWSNYVGEDIPYIPTCPNFTKRID